MAGAVLGWERREGEREEGGEGGDMVDRGVKDLREGQGKGGGGVRRKGDAGSVESMH